MARASASKGFSVVTLIIALVIVLGVGLTGWYIWISKNNKTPLENTSQSKEKASESTTIDFSESGKYLVISEWGVRFPLPDDLRGEVSYGIEQSKDGQTAWFAVKKIAALPGSQCDLKETTDSGVTGKTGGLGAFIRRTSNTLPDSEAALYSFANKKVGNYLYSGAYGKYADACAGNDEDKRQAASDAGVELTTAFEKLTKY